jgi:hypothetical protein
MNTELPSKSEFTRQRILPKPPEQLSRARIVRAAIYGGPGGATCPAYPTASTLLRATLIRTTTLRRRRRRNGRTWQFLAEYLRWPATVRVIVEHFVHREPPRFDTPGKVPQMSDGWLTAWLREDLRRRSRIRFSVWGLVGRPHRDPRRRPRPRSLLRKMFNIPSARSEAGERRIPIERDCPEHRAQTGGTDATTNCGGPGGRRRDGALTQRVRPGSAVVGRAATGGRARSPRSRLSADRRQ